MATAGKNKKTTNKSKTSVAKNSGTQNRKPRKNSAAAKAKEAKERALYREISLIILFVSLLFLFCCNFGIVGPVGNLLRDIMFGIFGLTAYIAPVVAFFAVTFWMANAEDGSAKRKIISGIILFFIVGILADLITGISGSMQTYDIVTLYEDCVNHKNGGGILAGSVSYLLQSCLETVGTVLVVLLASVICIILLTEKSIMEGLPRSKKPRREVAGYVSDEDPVYEQEEEDLRPSRNYREEEENRRILRMNKHVKGVALDTEILSPEDLAKREDVHEIVYQEEFENEAVASDVQWQEPEEYVYEQQTMDDISVHKEGAPAEVETTVRKRTPRTSPEELNQAKESLQKDMASAQKKTPKAYMFPPISRLQKGEFTPGNSARELKETALRLQQTLRTFGVNVTITDISQGPSVTRYELQPEQGVKVSRIVNLADDIKLNLAATDIRIEAPIPGKAAIGIEVPNKENGTVALRDLFETRDFKEFPSNIAFAVGKDIGGKAVVTDIAKMPHMLIAGATGSGKSVCINTLIMSILYKAHPDDVKLIMIDPKKVELGVYNGIPHLLIPVVTDPKKASAALHWGVSEMEDRYRKFEEHHVRDLKGYNKKVEAMLESGDPEAPKKLPQIVIIVDELADLMMVAAAEVEESICRLAQLARAAGIHLIIATQRPSVDVITGLIKANMPSRLAFSVSSGVDSRTILDQVGAEKLLGRGDMLFYPQGYTKPARIQGAFVSDKEVEDVVDFLKNQTIGNVYAEEIEEKIRDFGSQVSGGGGSAGGGGSQLDDLFAKAGQLIIEKDKASIGMLQRALQIGFNRAARIMDQLCSYGVVGEEEGTKPRKILMSPEQFEQLLEEI